MFKCRTIIVLLLILIVYSPANSFAQTGLLGRWRLDEDGGDSALEDIRGLSNGVLVGSPEWQPAEGAINGALKFNGSPDGIRIQCEDLEIFDLTMYFSLSAWVKQEEGNRGWVVLRTSQGSDLQRHYGIFSDGDNNSIEFHYFRYFAPRLVKWESVNIDGDGLWHLIIVTLRGGKADLYIDKQHIGSEYLSIGVTGWNENDPVPEILIGMRNDDTDGDESFRGLIDDVRIYNVTLDESDIIGDFTLSENSGTREDPFLISSRENLIFLADNPQYRYRFFKLVNDIDMCGPGGIEDCIQGKVIPEFRGEFDGNGHVISNFTYNSIANNNVGLFGVLVGKVSNLTMQDPLIRSHDGSNIGSIAGVLSGGRIQQCAVRGGYVTGGFCTGGLVGLLEGGVIEESISSTDVEGVTYSGGLAGKSTSGWIKHSYSEGSVTGNDYTGGAIGHCEAQVISCYSTAVVEGQENTGGLLGYGRPMEVTSSYWDIESSTVTSSSGGYGKSSLEMMERATYAGWGCYDQWRMDIGNDRPRLAWETEAGEIMSLFNYFEGSGEVDDPYRIYTAEDMNLIGAIPCLKFSNFILMNDIDMSGFDGQDDNPNYEMIGTFIGTFDGDHHSIANLSIQAAGVNRIGLFSHFFGSGEIRDLRLIAPSLSAGSGSKVGALVGYQGGANITRCGVDGGEIQGSSFVGGLVGYNYGGSVSNSYSTANVSAESTAGGLIGYLRVFTSNCYSEGSVSADERAGGFIGFNFGHASFCYSTGLVQDGESSGGLVGYGDELDVFRSYWNTETSSMETSIGGVGRTTAEMRSADSYPGWGCGEIWKIDEGNDTPRLAWEDGPGSPLGSQISLDGSGSEADPYLISNEEELNSIGLNPCIWDKHFLLESDLDMAGYDGVDGRPSYNPIGIPGTRFTGVFDGGGKRISNLTGDIGLFGSASGSDTHINDLALIDPDIQGEARDNVGGIVGHLGSARITGCSVEGGRVKGHSNVGGLAGVTYYDSKISNCFATCHVSSSGSNVGGLVGKNDSEISICYFDGSVYGGGPNVGGLVGKNNAGRRISNCFSRGSVQGSTPRGGLVGSNKGRISFCYSNARVVGNYNVGGLVGNWDSGGVTIASFWDLDTSLQYDSDGGEGKHTVEMMDKETYTSSGWDFTTPLWGINSFGTYPWLIYWNPDPGSPASPGPPGKPQVIEPAD